METITLRQIAERTGVPTTTLLALAADGYLKPATAAVKGRASLYSVAVVEAFGALLDVGVGRQAAARLASSGAARLSPDGSIVIHPEAHA
jgi:hypothetical protein